MGASDRANFWMPTGIAEALREETKRFRWSLGGKCGSVRTGWMWATFIVAAALLSFAEPGWGEPTHIDVRVISKGAKFIGTGVGGARITVTDLNTGELLAQGVTEGGTGDADRIMRRDRVPGSALSTADAAKFSATLDLDEPRLIEVAAFGPLAHPQGANRVSAVQWIVPGKHLTGGDGWLLEMPGLIVDLLAPSVPGEWVGVPRTIEIKAKVTMMCGCPITPGGLWDADEFEIVTLITRNGEPFGQTALSYAGEASRFAGSFEVDAPGTYEVLVYAYQASNGNTGLDKGAFIVVAE
ncbi:MAG: hypothetical protein ACPW60_12950 [Methylohalobius sp. ZOD2]